MPSVETPAEQALCRGPLMHWIKENTNSSDMYTVGTCYHLTNLLGNL